MTLTRSKKSFSELSLLLLPLAGVHICKNLEKQILILFLKAFVQWQWHSYNFVSFFFFNFLAMAFHMMFNEKVEMLEIDFNSNEQSLKENLS